MFFILSYVFYINSGFSLALNVSFCDILDETTLHLFHECVFAQNIWNQLRLYLAEKFDLPVYDGPSLSIKKNKKIKK